MRKLILIICALVWVTSFTSAFITENSQTYNASTFETSLENFRVNVTYNSTQFTSLACRLWYGSTAYTSSNSGSGSNAICSYSLDVPLISSGDLSYFNVTSEYFEGIQNSNITLFRSGGSFSAAVQGFTVGVVGNNTDYNITRIAIYYYAGGATTGTVRIYTLNSSNDAVTPLTEAASLPAASSPQKWTNITFAVPASVSAGRPYGIFLEETAGVQSFDVGLNTSNNSYTGGLIKRLDFTSGLWTSYTGDILFRLYGNAGGKNIIWEFTGVNSSGTYLVNSSTARQGVSYINLSICNPDSTVPFLNVTFRNETTIGERVNAAFTSAFNYYLGSGSIYKTYSYTSSAENSSYNFCSVPTHKPSKAELTSTYSNSYSQQRGFSDLLSLSNSTYNLTLYLLPTSLGQYVTFQVVNPADQPISGATVEVYLGSLLTESKTTDSSGGATFFLNPLSTYTVNASASGYNSLLSTITPTQTAYTLQLGGSSNATQNDYTRGVTYTIKPSLGTELQNNTAYNFNLTISSTYWNLDSYGFIIRNTTTSLNSTSGVSSSGGYLSTQTNTGSDDYIFMDLFYVVNGTYSNFTYSWRILDPAGASWSISILFTDIQSYTSSGLFGLDSFGLSLIIFFVIFIFTGVLTYQFGLSSPTAIMVVIWALVGFFDVALGLIPGQVGAVDNIATIVVSFILIAVFAWEASR